MGLHDNRRWRRLFGDDIERPQRIFWTLYYVDRRISLSCGRPYGIRDSDIHVEEPMVGYSPDVSLCLPIPFGIFGADSSSLTEWSTLDMDDHVREGSGQSLGEQILSHFQYRKHCPCCNRASRFVDGTSRGSP